MPDLKHLLIRCLEVSEDFYWEQRPFICQFYGADEVMEAELFLVVNCATLIECLTA